MKARINKIITFSNVDGPGNRMAIFFQGCPFRCFYCHNPETINHCINCGQCVKTCPSGALSIEAGKVVFDENKCVECDMCIKTCPHLADPRVKEYSVQELTDYVKKYQHFISGITVSGGECMLQADFLLAFFKEVKKLGLNCLIDSNGMIDFENHQELLAITDGVMLDVKASDAEFHYELTGGENKIVLKNLQFLQEVNKLYEVRTVIMPNKQEENKKTVDYVSEHLKPEIRYKLIEYRHFGVRDEGLKYFNIQTDVKSEIKKYKEELTMKGFSKVITI